jgi:hypothetical protein
VGLRGIGWLDPRSQLIRMSADAAAIAAYRPTVMPYELKGNLSCRFAVPLPNRPRCLSVSWSCHVSGNGSPRCHHDGISDIHLPQRRRLFRLRWRLCWAGSHSLLFCQRPDQAAPPDVARPPPLVQGGGFLAQPMTSKCLPDCPVGVEGPDRSQDANQTDQSLFGA